MYNLKRSAASAQLSPVRKTKHQPEPRPNRDRTETPAANSLETQATAAPGAGRSRSHYAEPAFAEASRSREHIALAHQAPRCVHIKPNGLRCGSPALKGVPWCYFHDHFFNGSIEENSFPPLEDGNGVQLALMWTLDRLRRDAFRGGETNVPVARTLVYGLQTAAWNLRNTNFDPALDRSTRDAFPRD